MGNDCKKCCGKMQDWCRDACGCCPCKCCKTNKIEVKTEQKFEQRIERKPIPFGRYSLYAGARTKDGSYSSPLLEIRTWRTFKMQKNGIELTLNQRVALGGIQTERDNADRHFGPTRGSEQRHLENEEEIIVIPIESIISMKCSTEVKKGQTDVVHIVLDKSPHVKLSCCQKVKNWCGVTFCCCCHENLNKQIQSKLPQTVTRIADQTAERRILITIEHMRYSHIHTPSHVRALAVSDQAEFYKQCLRYETLQFYLLDNADFNGNEFDSYRMQAAILCRLVTELKAMIGFYPDEATLKELVVKPSLFSIGNLPKETLEPLAEMGKLTSNLQVAIPQPAIRNN